MGFFGPITPPTLDESSAPVIRRALHRARIVGNFALVQATVQLLGFFSGILLIRYLSQSEYAYFTIANTMQGTINVLADIGITVGLTSIGGRVWHDRHRFGELVKTALIFRRKLGLLAVAVVTPVMLFMLVRNGAPSLYAAILVIIVVVGLLVQFSVGVLSVVPRLLSNLRWIQVIDLAGAILRLTLVGALLFVFLNAGVAVLIATIGLVVQYRMLRSYVRGVIDFDAPENEEDRREIYRLTKHLAANAVFYCVQGQITVFLISLFAHRSSAVAEVGALGRLAMVFTVLSNLLTNIFVPAFARCQDRRRLRWLYFGILGGVTVFSLVILGGAQFFPREFLFILGSKYSHLEHELLLMVGVAVASALTGTFWALNASKAWVSLAWLYIPLTLATQAVLIPFTDFSSVASVLTFNLLSAIPNLFLNVILSLRGFRSFGAVVA